jgi:hypothetical protein
MDETLEKEVRDGLFRMPGRRFGTVTEIMVARLTGAGRPLDRHHDLYDAETSQRIEVKASRVMRAHPQRITPDNVLQEILREGGQPRAMTFAEAMDAGFSCGLFQIKPEEFDLLVYGIFFADRIEVLRFTPADLVSGPVSLSRQHKGGDMGQMSIDHRSLPYCLERFHWLTMSYREFIGLLTTEEEEKEVA